MNVNNLFDELSRLAAVAGKLHGVRFALGNLISRRPSSFIVAISPAIPASWLRDFQDGAEKARVLEIGRLTGLREEAGRYYPANFERGLLLREIVRRHRPQRILELGTGRGLGILCMADQVRALEYQAELVSVDIIPPETRQHWPILIDGEFSAQSRSVEEVWSRSFPDLKDLVTLRTGATAAVLPALVEERPQIRFHFH